MTFVDYCLVVLGTSFDCLSDPTITPEFVDDSRAENNRVVDNVLINNGTNHPVHPFAFAAADLSFISLGAGNFFQGNIFSTSFSLIPDGIVPCE